VVRLISRMNVGGPAWQVSVLTSELDAHGFSTQLLSGSLPPHEASFPQIRKSSLLPLTVDGLGRRVSLLSDLRALFFLVRYLRRERPTIVHTHTAKAGFIGRLASVMTGVPIVVHTFHGHLLSGYFSTWKVRLIIVAERLLARKSSALIAVGTQVRSDLQRVGVGSRRRFEVIGPGVADVPQIDREALRASWGVTLGQPLVLYVGRVTRVKRLDRLIAAHRLVLKRFPDAVLAIAGEGELIAEVRQANYDIQGSIRFLGWLSDAPSLYGAADVAVLASDNEGTPVSLIEAAMAGVSAVSTRVGSVPEVILDGVTGLLCDPDPGSLAESICSLLGDPDRRQMMGVAARRRAVHEFSTERLVADHVALYRSLISDAGLSGSH